MTEERQNPDPGRELVADLAKASHGKVLTRTAVVVVTYTAAVVLALRPGIGWSPVFFSVFLAFVLTGCLNAAHDCVHRGHLRSKRANRIAGAVWGTPILLNFSIYRLQHLVHHRFTGVEGDPEAPQHFDDVRSYLRSLSGLPFWPALAKSISRNVRGDFPEIVNNDERRRDARIDSWVIAGWLAAIIMLTAFFPFPLLVAYWLPLFLVMPAAMILSMPEHYGLWGTPDVMRNTRTIRSNVIVRFFNWNGNYHAEHHLFPAVASVNLHRLHVAMPKPHPVQEKSYLRFHYGLLRALLKGDTDYGRVPEPAADAPVREG